MLKRVALVVDDDVADALAQLVHLVEALDEAIGGAEDAGLVVHDLREVVAHLERALAARSGRRWP